jgi:hypothetical protein
LVVVVTGAEARRERLEHATAVRVRRSEWKREVAGLSRSAALDRFAAMLAVQPEWARGMRVEDAARSLPYIGPRKLEMLLAGFLRSPRFGELTARERDLLLAWVRRERDRADGAYGERVA